MLAGLQCAVDQLRVGGRRRADVDRVDAWAEHRADVVGPADANLLTEAAGKPRHRIDEHHLNLRYAP